MRKRVLLGMSGGIDSSVAALRLLEMGYDVTGITFLFSGNGKEAETTAGAAEVLAKRIGIPHYTVDLTDAFHEKIIRYFRHSYIHGETPFPCAVCNPEIKFAQLMEIAGKMKCELISTGHYVQLIEQEGYTYISKGIDPEKDQSFFLWGLNQDVLKRVIFPLGGLHKREVREIASADSFHHLTEKKESVGICFISGGDYRQYLNETELDVKPGFFIDRCGNVLGQHKGIVHYTVGQRRGLGLQLNKRLFVNELRAETNEIVLGDYSDMYRTRIFLRNIRFTSIAHLDTNRRYTVRIRYRNQENECRIMFHDEHRAVVELCTPLAMVAPGQTAVIYDGNRVSGGGFIERSE